MPLPTWWGLYWHLGAASASEPALPLARSAGLGPNEDLHVTRRRHHSPALRQRWGSCLGPQAHQLAIRLAALGLAFSSARPGR